jgi:hypothetical protein
MSRHRSALVADFHRYYGLSVSAMKEWGIPLTEVCDMAVNLPLDSAVRRSVDPHWQRTPEIDILRDVEHNLRVLAWQQTSSAKKGIGYPEPMRLPWDADPEGTVKGDRMTTDEMDEFLGWDKLKAERGIS